MNDRSQNSAAIAARQANADDPQKVRRRFLAKVAHAENGCWPWLGARMSAGNYGIFWLHGASEGAHRASYRIFKTQDSRVPIPDGFFVLHSCDDRTCVNPDHLSLGTHQQNMREAVERNRMRKGEGSNSAKMSDREVAEIKAEYVKRDGEVPRLATKYNTTINIIESIVSGKTWVHIKPAQNVQPTSGPIETNRMRGATHQNTSLTEEDVAALRADRSSGMTYAQLGEKYGLSRSAAHAISARRTWRPFDEPPPPPRKKQTKLTDIDVIEMRLAWINAQFSGATTNFAQKLATRHGMSRFPITQILSNTGWKHSTAQVPERLQALAKFNYAPDESETAFEDLMAWCGMLARSPEKVIQLIEANKDAQELFDSACQSAEETAGRRLTEEEVELVAARVRSSLPARPQVRTSCGNPMCINPTHILPDVDPTFH